MSALENGGEALGSTESDYVFVVDDPSDEQPFSPSLIESEAAPEPVAAVAEEDEERQPKTAEVSDRKREANRRNGRKGGPRTPEGKKRVGQNALRYGGHASAAPIVRGAFIEDPEEVTAFIEAIVESLTPSCAALEEAARRYALACLRERRLERYITAQVAAVTAISDHTLVVANRSSTSQWVLTESDIARLSLFRIFRSFFERSIPVSDGEWEDLCYEFLEPEGVDPIEIRGFWKVELAGVWDDDHEPGLVEEWRALAYSMRDRIYAADIVHDVVRLSIDKQRMKYSELLQL